MRETILLCEKLNILPERAFNITIDDVEERTTESGKIYFRINKPE